MTRIATSIEESKRLLKLGIDPNTADMSYDWIGGKVYDLCLAPCVNEMDIPAWSLSKLFDTAWELDPDQVLSFQKGEKMDLIAIMVDFIEMLVNEGYIKGKEDKQ